LAVQQKQIIVTCNYEARRRGLHKLQRIREAKKLCPDVVIVLGEDLTRFRDASKDLYNFLRQAIWSGKVERLGFDEVWYVPHHHLRHRFKWLRRLPANPRPALRYPTYSYKTLICPILTLHCRLDCTDMVEYNLPLLNHNDLSHSFFCLDRDDPTVGFAFDASTVFGPTYPPDSPNTAFEIPSANASGATNSDDDSRLRLLLGSHLARHLRHELESQKGYTATVGIAANKVLSKLVGNVHKPKNQTTLLPPFAPTKAGESNVMAFMDAHDIGKVPGIGFKLAQKIRARILGRTPAFQEGLVYGGTEEAVTVRDVRLFPGMGPEMLEEVLGGPGSQKGIGGRIWGLINGVDETEVGKAKRVPTQISIEDSYVRLDTFEQVKKELLMLAKSLIRRMHADLTEDDDVDTLDASAGQRKWLAHPRTLRLSTRPRPPLHPDGSRTRSFNRISRSAPMPNFVFNLNESDASVAEKLVQEALIPAFRKLHPEKSGWNLSLVNVAATNMAETAAETKDSEGRDIGRMLKRQDEVLKDWKIINDEASSEDHSPVNDAGSENHAAPLTPQGSDGGLRQDAWESDDLTDDLTHSCGICGSVIPLFALTAHDRYHSMAE
jgi:DNA polymerase iota